MRELYSLSFTPNKPINKTEYYDSVSEIIINGETLEDRDKRIVQEYIDEVVKKLSSYMEYYGDMGKCDKFEAYVNALRIIKGRIVMVEIKEEYYIKRTSTRIIDSFRNSETTVTEEKFDVENHDNLLIGQVLDLFCQELSRYEHSEGGIVYMMSGTVNQIAESVRDKMSKGDYIKESGSTL